MTTHTCECQQPVPVQQATRKGAAVTLCARCGGAVPLRLNR
jgi:hypothetical protein